MYAANVYFLLDYVCFCSINKHRIVELTRIINSFTYYVISAIAKKFDKNVKEKKYNHYRARNL